jgi:hypothetical protein
LQFRHAEPDTPEAAASRRCALCKLPIRSTYYQAAGRDVCPNCTGRIQSVQAAPPPHALLTAALYGGGAAIAGCILYAFVAIQFGVELALIAILIGYMVGKAVRHGSRGLGGRPQQILAVLFTYFAITFSYIAVYIYHAAEKPHTAAQTASGRAGRPTGGDVAQALGAIVLLAAVAPFLALAGNFVGGAISLVIIFFGLRQAWRMTGRPNIPIFGPYNAAEPT